MLAAISAVSLSTLVVLTRPGLLRVLGDGDLLFSLLAVCLALAGASTLGFFSLGESRARAR